MFRKIWSYITFEKQQHGGPKNFNLAMMHGINRISILMFLAGIIYLAFKIFR
jgi:hypothetical protein